MKQKINLRLFLIALIAVVVSTVAITFVYYELFTRQVRQDLKLNAELLNDTELFQSMYEYEATVRDTTGSYITDENEDLNAPDSLGQRLKPQTAESLKRFKNQNLRITWMDAEGYVIYDNDTDAAALENHLDRPEVSDALAYGEGESIRRSKTMNLATFYYAMRLDNGTVLRVAMQVSTVISLFFTAAPVIFVIIAAVLAACVVLSRMLTRTLLKPIEDMAEHMDDHNEIPIYPELKPFADRIRSQHEHILASAESRQDFTANVTHELKTPLTAISGYAELIENNMIGADQTGHIASQIRHNADRLLSMINDIIQLSELDHKDLPRSFADADLNAIAAECCDNLRVAAAKARITLDYKGEPVHLSADRALIKELIENLVQNAIRYNHEGGHVWVTVSEASGHAVLKVRDDGIGIPKDKQARVFERFYRVDKGRSRDMGGTGLGLAIVKHIAEIHNAEISLDSILGEGTDISVRF